MSDWADRPRGWACAQLLGHVAVRDAVGGVGLALLAGLVGGLLVGLLWGLAYGLAWLVRS